ncbi:MAG: hypothetical protein AAF907_14120, partial [Planctomycetota bacterium]
MPATLAPPSSPLQRSLQEADKPKPKAESRPGFSEAKLRAAARRERVEAEREQIYDSFSSKHLWRRISWPVLIWITAMHIGAVAALFF